MGYSFLKVFFFVFHTVFTLFNLAGWAFRRSRRLHLATLGLTAASWFVLGAWLGWGYCLCTDRQGQERARMGLHHQSRSYIHFLILKVTGATLIGFGASAVLSIALNVRDARRRKAARAAGTLPRPH